MTTLTEVVIEWIFFVAVVLQSLPWAVGQLVKCIDLLSQQYDRASEATLKEMHELNRMR
jgi:hypothetical protein